MRAEAGGRDCEVRAGQKVPVVIDLRPYGLAGQGGCHLSWREGPKPHGRGDTGSPARPAHREIRIREKRAGPSRSNAVVGQPPRQLIPPGRVTAVRVLVAIAAMVLGNLASR